MNVAERLKRSATATRVVVRCLGRFRLEDACGNQLQIRTRKARALLAALALPGRPMSRDALADLLWSERGPAQARSSLRQRIFELQHVLGDEAQILVAGRDELSVRRDHLVTDIDLIRGAAADADWARLLALLESSEAGLLTDLDGLDQEFDSWLRMERGQEPAKTLATTVDAAERCLAEAGPRAALDLVSEILRLDPVNEEATRLALRIDRELGDSRALHHHFEQLRERLHDEYGAEPSSETVELFKRLSDAPAKALSASKEELPGAAVFSPERQPAVGWWKRAAAPLLVLVAALGLLAILVLRERESAPAANEPILVAVLPFEHQSRGDSYLAEGLWDDTRAALSRNRSLRVLGRTTTRAVAERNLAPSEYRRRLGVDYLLEGNVRRSGDQVLVSVALTRAADGVGIWEDGFRARLGDPIALQEAIAAGIEGKLRGRLAKDGGRRADQIATSPEVYAQYSEARALLRTREVNAARRAQVLLRQALASDPNFAPAWSSLGASIWFSDLAAVQDSKAQAEATAAARRAIALAPNLAEAHATAALLAGENHLEAERPIRRALALDRSNSEAWNWLGNALNGQSRFAEAMQAYRQSVKLDPLWFPPVHNFAATASELNDAAAFNWLIGKITSAGASRELIYTTRADYLSLRGDYSGALKLLMAIGVDSRGRPPPSARSSWCDALARLGYYDEAARVGGFEGWFGPLLRGERLPPPVIDGRRVTPADFWGSLFFPSYASRAMVNLGHGGDLVRIYRRAFRNADEFISRTGKGETIVYLAPNLAVALNSSGEEAEADYILAAAAQRAEAALKTAPNTREANSRMAFTRAAQGNRVQALSFLQRAVERGWLPDGNREAIDIAQEPAFRDLRGDPRFETIRKRILDHIAKERAELGPLKV
jgi:DNA-binding SARP family transcriptional activator/TolB-like protein